MKPAVEDYVSKHLGQAITDHMMRGDGGVTYSTRTHFLYDVLKRLLHEDSFQMYKEYTRSYETFVKNWMKEQIIKEMSSGEQMQQLETELLNEIVKKITATITSISKDMDIEEFIPQFCSDLKDQLVFPRDALDDFLILINAKTDQFAINLKEFIKEMELHLAKGYAKKKASHTSLKELHTCPLNPMSCSSLDCLDVGNSVPSVGHPVKQEVRTTKHTSPAYTDLELL